MQFCVSFCIIYIHQSIIINTQTLFQPLLSNNGYIRMHISALPSNNELKYSIDIQHFRWNDDENSMQFCLNVFIPNAQNLHFKCSNIESIVTRSTNNVDICHRFHSNQDFYLSHIYYSTLSQTEDANLTHSTLANYTLFTLNEQNTASTSINHQNIWLFAVFIVIMVIVLIFVIVILYLIKDGVFDSNKKPKRKKSTITIVDTRPSSNRHSLPNSPNLRINVTYHNPNNAVQNEEEDYDKRMKQMEISKTNSRPLFSLQEGNEEEEEDENDDLHNTITPLYSYRHTFNDSGTGIEESIIQYIINSQQRTNDLDKPSSPIPFCSA